MCYKYICAVWLIDYKAASRSVEWGYGLLIFNESDTYMFDKNLNCCITDSVKTE